jgi:periplasmic divalent cation tolerance protein
MQPRLIYTTFPSEEIASELSETLVKEGLVRCANILGTGRSIFRWEGAVESARETFAIFKTTDDKLADLERRFHEFHPYDVPAFIVLAPEAVSEAYRSWLLGSE